jgi:hypothetical protein
MIVACATRLVLAPGDRRVEKLHPPQKGRALLLRVSRESEVGANETRAAPGDTIFESRMGWRQDARGLPGLDFPRHPP